MTFRMVRYTCAHSVFGRWNRFFLENRTFFLSVDKMVKTNKDSVDNRTIFHTFAKYWSTPQHVGLYGLLGLNETSKSAISSLNGYLIEQKWQDNSYSKSKPFPKRLVSVRHKQTLAIVLGYPDRKVRRFKRQPPKNKATNENMDSRGGESHNWQRRA